MKESTKDNVKFGIVTSVGICVAVFLFCVMFANTIGSSTIAEDYPYAKQDGEAYLKSVGFDVIYTNFSDNGNIEGVAFDTADDFIAICKDQGITTILVWSEAYESHLGGFNVQTKAHNGVFYFIEDEILYGINAIQFVQSIDK